jgi:HNH endonuclease
MQALERSIEGFPRYTVRMDGTVWRDEGSQECLQEANSHGYQRVTMKAQDGRWVHRKVHPLVAKAFLGPRPSDCPVIRHLDGDRANNGVFNLAYGTQKQNVADALDHETHQRGVTNAASQTCTRFCTTQQSFRFTSSTPLACSNEKWRSGSVCADRSSQTYCTARSGNMSPSIPG